MDKEYKEYNINKKAIVYILGIVQCQIDKNIWAVIYDSEEDPQISAVTTTNLIKCWLELKDNIGEPTGVNTLQEYFDYVSLPDEDYEIFERKRKKESEYYNGEQF